MLKWPWGAGSAGGEGGNEVSSTVAQMVKSLPAMQETWVSSLGWEDPLEKGKAPIPVSWPGESHVHGIAHSQTRLSDFHFQ